MQNEELRRAQEELEAAGRKYADLYNFAPVGYFTLDKRGVITEANVTGARLLGSKKSILIGKPFAGFLAEVSESKDFFAHLHEARMDIAMPDLNGIEATGLISKAAPSVRVIILSMYHTAEHVFRAVQARSPRIPPQGIGRRRGR